MTILSAKERILKGDTIELAMFVDCDCKNGWVRCHNLGNNLYSVLVLLAP